TVTRAGCVVALTALECRLLSYLMHRAGVVVSKSTLTEHIYDQSFDRDSNVIEVMVNRLRKKLGADFIKTKRGIGYMIDQLATFGEEPTAPTPKKMPAGRQRT